MRRLYQRTLCCVACGLMFTLGGCVTNQQLGDFVRTQFARVVSDLVGQSVRTFVQATS